MCTSEEELYDERSSSYATHNLVDADTELASSIAIDTGSGAFKPFPALSYELQCLSMQARIRLADRAGAFCFKLF
jgi:hypothetical protein